MREGRAKNHKRDLQAHQATAKRSTNEDLSNNAENDAFIERIGVDALEENGTDPNTDCRIVARGQILPPASTCGLRRSVVAISSPA